MIYSSISTYTCRDRDIETETDGEPGTRDLTL